MKALLFAVFLVAILALAGCARKTTSPAPASSQIPDKPSEVAQPSTSAAAFDTNDYLDDALRDLDAVE